MYDKMRGWISESCPENLETFDASLNEPATSADIERLEATTGCPVLDEWRSVYETADGMGTTVFRFSPWRVMAIHEAVRSVQGYTGMEVVDELLTEFAWQSAWLPFAIDRSGDLICVNLRPASDAKSDDEQPYGISDRGDLFVHRHEENQILSISYTLIDWSEYWIEETLEFAR